MWTQSYDSNKMSDYDQERRENDEGLETKRKL